MPITMSMTFTIVAIVVIAILVFVAKGGIEIANESDIRVSEVPAVFSQLKATGSDGSFAVFLPSPERSKSDESVNIQFSIENGVIGLDWVLVSPANIRDREKFERVARDSRFHYHETEMNGVRYLRTEDREAAGLCVELLTDIYGLSLQDTVGLLADSFEWPGTAGEQSA